MSIRSPEMKRLLAKTKRPAQKLKAKKAKKK